MQKAIKKTSALNGRFWAWAEILIDWQWRLECRGRKLLCSIPGSCLLEQRTLLQLQILNSGTTGPMTPLGKELIWGTEDRQFMSFQKECSVKFQPALCMKKHTKIWEANWACGQRDTVDIMDWDFQNLSARYFNRGFYKEWWSHGIKRKPSTQRETEWKSYVCWGLCCSIYW